MPGYARRSTPRSYFYGAFPPGIKWLLIINSAVFVLWYLGGAAVQIPMNALLGLSAAAAIHNLYIWQPFTYLFMHAGVWHLVFNMFALWMFGKQLEQDWGTRRFLKYYFFCGIAAGLCVLATDVLVHDTLTLGASGAIFGVLVAFGVCYPNQTILMDFLFPIKAKYMVMIYAGVELLFMLGPNNGVSTVAHLGGMAFGYVYLKGRLPRLNLPDVTGAYRQWKLQRAKKKFQVYMRKQGGRSGPWVN